jgi:hypothetical protein
VFATLAWWPVAWRPPAGGITVALGLGVALCLCKALSIRPAWRAVIATAPALLALPWLGTAARPALAGTLAASVGYLGFSLARQAMHAVRGWRFHTPDGRADGWDYGRWVVLRERMLARLWPWGQRRILFPPTDMEAGLREGFRHRGDRLAFAEPTPELVRDHDLVVPLTLDDVERLRHFPGLQRNPLPLPDADCVALCNDKLACNRVLTAAGFGDCIPRMSDSPAFPYILKKRIDAWGENTHVIASAADERRLGALLRDPDYFRQAFVPGRREYAAHLLVRDGRIVAALAVEYGFAHELHKKCREQPPHYRRLRRPAHLPLFRGMLAALGYEGLCCVNYKVHNERVWILEINPRFGASLAPWFFAMMRALPRAAPLRARATTSAARPTTA